MSYAYILGLAPYGIIAGSVLTPLLRSLSTSPVADQLQLLQVTISSLAGAWPLEVGVCLGLTRLSQPHSVLVSAGIMVPMAVLISCLSQHLVTLALSGGVFAAAEVSAVAQLLPLVQASAIFGVFRDVVMRIHYVRGTAWQVLRLNLFLLVANLGLDVFTLSIGLGAYGLLASTVLINFSACALVWGGVAGAPGKVRSIVACCRDVALTVVLASLSWVFANWASPHVLGVVRSCCGLPAGGAALCESLSKSSAAAACAAFSIPMAVSYALLYGGYYLTFKR